jgi:peptidoglycan/LPS O-acetylase OafA/YrhL
MLCMAFSPVINLRGFARRGDLSYGLYLYAYPAQQLLIQELGPETSPIGLFFVALAASAGLATLSWRYVEWPCLKHGGPQPDGRQARTRQDRAGRKGDEQPVRVA